MSASPSDTPPAERRYAEIAVALPVRQTYTYRLPEGLRPLARLGAVVRVPVRGRDADGVVVGFPAKPPIAVKRLKPVEQILTPDYALTPDLLALGRWMSEYYLSGPGETLATVAFFGLADMRPRKTRRLSLPGPLAEEGLDRLRGADGKALTRRQKDVVRFFVENLNEPVTRAELQRREGCSAPLVANLLEKGVLVETEAHEPAADLYAAAPGEREAAHAMNADQRRAFAAVRDAADARRFEAFLLYGVTGSGKTEVYLQAISRVLERGCEALLLVPEISLTPQAVDRFRKRLGACVGVYHSNLTRAQKYDLWRRIDAGEVRVLIGARSAVFAPFPNLGLIVVDEEHEHSYKQGDPAPRYHARDVALWRGRQRGAPVVLGSATPSLESLRNVALGKLRRLDLPVRAGGASMPEVRLIDMGAQVREERRTSLLSDTLAEAIARRLGDGEQSILFLNRRGFANFLICMACRAVVRCPHCDVVMTWHKAIGRLMCHLCGATALRPEKCPECGEDPPMEMGAGTQRIEEEVVERFPEARVLRIDLDTTRGKHGFLRLWERIEKGGADILLGTQMIAKGLHLERVTLVGVVSADHALFLPDFRAGERAFAMLTQVAGRAGRMAQRGEVFIQTFMPHHYAIQRAVAHDCEGFWKQEMHMREMLRFPPFKRLLLARLSGEKPDQVRARAERLGKLLRDRMARRPEYGRSVSLLGPLPSPIERIQDRTRWQLVLRGEAPSVMRRLMLEALETFEKDKGRAGVSLTLDVDPMDLL